MDTVQAGGELSHTHLSKKKLYKSLLVKEVLKKRLAGARHRGSDAPRRRRGPGRDQSLGGQAGDRSQPGCTHQPSWFQADREEPQLFFLRALFRLVHNQLLTVSPGGAFLQATSFQLVVLGASIKTCFFLGVSDILINSSG